MQNFTLPDGRVPIRFGKGRTAIYRQLHGDGEVEYMFSMIRFIQKRPRLSSVQLSERAKQRAAKIKESNPDFYSQIGRKGGKVRKNDSKDSKDS